MPPEHLGSRSLGGSLAGTRSRAKRKTNGPNGLDRGSEKSGCARTSENVLGRNLWRTRPKKKPDREVCVAAPIMSEPGPGPVVRPVIAPMRWLLYSASTLVFLAGFELTGFRAQPDTY